MFTSLGFLFSLVWVFKVISQNRLITEGRLSTAAFGSVGPATRTLADTGASMAPKGGNKGFRGLHAAESMPLSCHYYLIIFYYYYSLLECHFTPQPTGHPANPGLLPSTHSCRRELTMCDSFFRTQAMKIICGLPQGSCALFAL